MSVWWVKSVECTASMFPLDNLTRVSTAVHSNKNLLSNHFLASQLHFGTSYSFIACIYWHRQGRGLALILSCRSWKYSWRWGLTQLLWVFPLSDGHG